MACIHSENAPINAPRGGCQECGNPNDVVVFEAIIADDETGAVGPLVLCTGCVLSAGQVAYAGRTKMLGSEDWARNLNG